MFSSQQYLEAKASGNFEAFVKSASSFVITELKYTQKGTVYTKAIDKGRGPGGVLRQQIYEWLRFKKYGLDWATESERKSLAFLISRKISQSGSFKFRNPSSQTEIVDDAIGKTLPGLIEEITNNEAEKVALQITKLYGN